MSTPTIYLKVYRVSDMKAVGLGGAESPVFHAAGDASVGLTWQCTDSSMQFYLQIDSDEGIAVPPTEESNDLAAICKRL